MPRACYAKGMSFIQIKNVPEALHEAVRRRATAEGITISQYVLDLVQRDLALPSPRDWHTHLATRPAVDVDVVSALEAARSERSHEVTGA